MNENSIGDPTLGLNSQALAVLHALVGEEDEHFGPYTDTYAWYNGRERGFVLVYDSGGGAFCVACAESRGSDNIVVYNWEQEFRGTNPPTAADVPEEAWGRGKNFKPLQVDKVVKYILKELTFKD
jgi:hypothetical protein